MAHKPSSNQTGFPSPRSKVATSQRNIQRSKRGLHQSASEPNAVPTTDDSDHVQAPTDPLDDWLSSLGREGQLESEGSFRMDREKAWEKLGAFQLPFAEAWVLKLVQAAVVGGATSIDVVQTNAESRFQFVAVENWRWEELQKRIFDMDAEPDTALSHLAVAVRALAKATTHVFRIVFPEDTVVVWDGQAFQVGEADSTEVEFSITISHGRTLAVVMGRRTLVGIQKALTDHCHLCPVFIIIDTRPINSVVDGSFGQPLSECIPLAFQKIEVSPELPGFSLPRKVWQDYVPSGPQPALDVAHKFDNSNEPCGAAIMVCGFSKTVHMEERSFKSDPRNSELAWVRHGVIVARESLGVKEPVACLVLLSAAGLDTDLTGLELRQTDSYKERRHRGLASSCNRLDALWQKGQIVRQGRSTVLSLMGWQGLVLGALVPPAGLAILANRWSNITSAKEEQAREFCQAWKRMHHGLLNAQKAAARN